MKQAYCTLFANLLGSDETEYSFKSHKADLLLTDKPRGKVAALQCHILDLQGSGSLARWTLVCTIHGSHMPHTEGLWKITDFWFYTPKVQESLGKGI